MNAEDADSISTQAFREEFEPYFAFIRWAARRGDRSVEIAFIDKAQADKVTGCLRSYGYYVSPLNERIGHVANVGW